MKAGVEKSPTAQRMAPSAAHRGGRSPRTAGQDPESAAPEQRRPPKPGDPGGRSDPGREADTEPRAAPPGTAQPAQPAGGTGAGLAAPPGTPQRGLQDRGAGSARTYLGGAVSSGDPPAASWRKSRGKFLRPTLGGCELQQLLRCGAATPSGPAGGFHLLQGAPGITQGKRPVTGAADFPRSLTGKRKAPLGVPETLDYPHRADPEHSLVLTHAGGDRQDATAIRARGEGHSAAARPTEGCGLPRNSAPRLPPPASSLLPLFLPD